MFKISEIRKWAKPHDITIKNKDDGYYWFVGKSGEGDVKTLDETVTDIFNYITDNAWVEYQKTFDPSKLRN